MLSTHLIILNYPIAATICFMLLNFMLVFSLQYVRPYAGNLSKEAFNAFIEHLTLCAAHYRIATVKEAMR